MDPVLKFVLGILLAFASLVGLGYLSFLGQERAQALERQRRAQAIEDLHKTDLQPLYERINEQSFGGELPSDTTAIWANLNTNRYCAHNEQLTMCGGMTDWDTGKPRIRINTETVQSDYSLQHLIRHEMCHVAVHQAGEDDGKDFHGPAFQECMKRFGKDASNW